MTRANKIAEDMAEKLGITAEFLGQTQSGMTLLRFKEEINKALSSNKPCETLSVLNPGKVIGDQDTARFLLQMAKRKAGC